MNTYDIVFYGDNSSDCKGFKSSLQYCIDYISMHNGTDHSYFADYKGGIVEVVCNQTGKTYFSDLVR